MDIENLPIIGRNTLVEIVGHIKDVPAKVDTGADSSSIWATEINVDRDGILSFKLFGPKSAFYSGEKLSTKRYKAALVRSSSGHEQVRYRVKLPIVVKGLAISAGFYLSDRSLNRFPILLGRRTINKKFLVDVSRYEYDDPAVESDLPMWDEFRTNPHEFHKKYHFKNHESEEKN